MARVPRRQDSGFTLVELVVVMVVIGGLAVVALPKLSSLLGMRQDAYRDSLVAGLRVASVTAQHHRRLVCATLDAAGNLRLRIAAANPASACTHDYLGPDGAPLWAAAPSGTSLTASPGADLYFQPVGGVSATAAGAVVDFSLQLSGGSIVSVRGRNGHAE